MKTKNPKKTSTVILTLAIAVLLVTTLIIAIIVLTKPQEDIKTMVEKGKIEQFYENGWDSSVVSEIRDGDIPVPVGFEYVSGNKNTGLIIQNKKNKKQYVWIPYSEVVDNEESKKQVIQEYFGEKDDLYTNPDKLAEMQKYGGFYAGIGEIEENGDFAEAMDSYAVASLSQKDYQVAEKKAKENSQGETAVDASVLGKEELSMLLDFSQKEKVQNTPISMVNLYGKEIQGMNKEAKRVDLNKKILFIGNSLFQQMESALVASGSKENTDKFIAKDGATLEAIRPYITSESIRGYEIAVIEMGTNEVWDNYNEQLYIEQYTDIVNTLKNAGIHCYLLSTPPVLPEKGTWASYAQYINNEKMRERSSWTQKVAQATGARYVDCTPFFGTELQDNWTYDGVHMTFQVYHNWYKWIREQIKEILENPNPPTDQNENPKPTQNTLPVQNTLPSQNTTKPEEQTKKAYTGEILTVKPGSSKTEESKVPEKWQANVETIINGVPVPKGFEVAEYYGNDEKTGFAIRQKDSKESENLHRLCYVWVPVNTNASTITSLEDAKKELNDIYQKAGLNTKTSESATEDLPKELVESVKEYGGFYIAMGELGYDNNGKFYNRPRGMKESKEKPGWFGVDYGNYFHAISEKLWDKTTPVNYQKANETYDNIIKEFTYEKILKVCDMLSSDSVTSHLTYGAEWDATMLWLLKEDIYSPEDFTYLLLTNSSDIGKYRGAMLNAKLLNHIWGLAGNLAEITQEKIGDKIVTRGGSYATLGNESPIASRTAIEESEIRTSDQYGFRNCLYINIEKKADSELQKLIDSEKATTKKVTTVKDAEGKAVVIPQGFKVTKDAYFVKEGVVIENEKTSDQFVWVPVEDISKMYQAKDKVGKLYDITKEGSILKEVTHINNKYFEPGVIQGADNKSFDASSKNLQIVGQNSVEDFEKQLKKEFLAMIESVKSYGGFYIARYETSNVDTKTPATVQKDGKNRTHINWYEAYEKNKQIAVGNYGVTGMIWGSQWDETLKWLQSMDKSGNRVNHIEDLANGTEEWTMEAYANDARIVRDVTKEESAVLQAGTRMDYNPSEETDKIGSRAMMYVK